MTTVKILERAMMNPAIDTAAFNMLLDAHQDVLCWTYPCPACDGFGWIGTHDALCPACDGFGWREDAEQGIW